MERISASRLQAGLAVAAGPHRIESTSPTLPPEGRRPSCFPQRQLAAKEGKVPGRMLEQVLGQALAEARERRLRQASTDDEKCRPLPRSAREGPKRIFNR